MQHTIYLFVLIPHNQVWVMHKIENLLYYNL